MRVHILNTLPDDPALDLNTLDIVVDPVGMRLIGRAWMNGLVTGTVLSFVGVAAGYGIGAYLNHKGFFNEYRKRREKRSHQDQERPVASTSS